MSVNYRPTTHQSGYWESHWSLTFCYRNQTEVHFQYEPDELELLLIGGPSCKGKMGEPKSSSWKRVNSFPHSRKPSLTR
ncbi:hypothetical protein L1887_36855 [Cichorium endivia]|nr:hypothetical protein L1887_36855 [Cichorium endivia]